jgi:hypothetical protein
MALAILVVAVIIVIVLNVLKLPAHIDEALVVFGGAIILWIYILISFKTDTAYRYGGKHNRQESPIGFWITIAVQTGIALFLTLYALKLWLQL